MPGEQGSEAEAEALIVGGLGKNVEVVTRTGGRGVKLEQASYLYGEPQASQQQMTTPDGTPIVPFASVAKQNQNADDSWHSYGFAEAFRAGDATGEQADFGTHADATQGFAGDEPSSNGYTELPLAAGACGADSSEPGRCTDGDDRGEPSTAGKPGGSGQ